MFILVAKVNTVVVLKRDRLLLGFTECLPNCSGRGFHFPCCAIWLMAPGLVPEYTDYGQYISKMIY